MRSRAGYMLLELVIAAAITCAVAALLFQLAIAAQGAVSIQGSTADQQQRLRVVAEALRRDLSMAGAGPSRGSGRGPLIRIFPPVLPARVGLLRPDPELTAESDRISIVYVPETRAQTKLESGMAAASSPLAIDGSAPGCVPGTACDFAPGDRAVIYDPSIEGGPHELLTVAAVDAARALLMPSAPLSRPYASGARVAVVTVRSYYLDAATRRLMVYDGDGSDVPLVDRVAEMEVGYLADQVGTTPQLLPIAQLADGPVSGEAPNRFDADLLRIRRIRVRLRLQNESPIGSVRDLETTIDIAPPNMAAR
jgi:type II secretory pathway pseudopilin PulG